MLFGPEQRKQLKLASRVGAVGIELALAVVIGLYAGRWLDEKLGTAPWLATVGFVLGIAAGFKTLWTIARTTNLDDL